MSPAKRSAATPARRRAVSNREDDASEQLDNVTRAYQTLRLVIVSGQLPPGSPISERLISARLGLSRTPVRSALHRLEQEGFVAANGLGRERRLIVAPLTMDDGREVMFIVGHLEGLAARTAALLPAPRRREIARNLREINTELAEESKRAGDADRFFELDHVFHNRYIDGVVGPRLLTLHRAIKPQSDRYSRLYVSVLLDQLTTSVKEHEKIAASIAKGDADAAQRAAETNWHNAAERLTKIIAKEGERGSWQAWAPEEPPARKR
ncbi:MAG: GntR family transcriptional regulator [Gemmatimonadetes bacterium]|nr:GntR family transcriptional regulator [Gemmatimonadota bacterium]